VRAVAGSGAGATRPSVGLKLGGTIPVARANPRTPQNPAHLRRPIGPGTAQVVIRSADPQLADIANIRGRWPPCQWKRLDVVDVRRPGVIVLHAAMLAAAAPRGPFAQQEAK
jgi:hypothetical protein